MNVESSPDFVASVYASMRRKLEIVRGRLNRPLALAEKLMYGHLDDPANEDINRGSSYIRLRPDRVALQDATAQMAILQFMLAGRDQAALPVTVHCDHLIRAETGATPDLKSALDVNREVYDFLASAAQRYGFGFWRPGSGIIHQVVLEQYAFPGLLMIGTDSHTPNAGGLGTFASGVGGADAVDVMVGLPWEVLHPELVGVKLTGSLQGWTAPKDVIIKLLGELTCAGGTNRVIEYFGPGAEGLSATGKATICNMGAELGATTSTFAADETMVGYLKATGRDELAELVAANMDLLRADDGVYADPESVYDLVVEIDLSTLEPQVVGPHRPDRAVAVSGMAAHLEEGGWPTLCSSALIGSCTNSSYEDMGRVAAMADRALAAGATVKSPLYITPGSEQVRATIERDGILERIQKLGVTLLANACGPCIGQWKRNDMEEGKDNSIISSYNRNFPKRNDGSAATCAFIASPETVLAYALHGRLDVDPFNTPIPCADGGTLVLNEADTVAEIPSAGYVRDEEGYVAPPDEVSTLSVVIAEGSDRLQSLTPFPAWEGTDLTDLLVLVKVQGACTTDHISPAGKWLRFRGHLENISENAFAGAVNAFTGETGHGTNIVTGSTGNTYPENAKAYRDQGIGWVAVGDTNYGEGSSREHAAMSPRFLGARAVIVRAFARIHESNLKKQGVLPLTFVNASDYDLIRETDRLDLLGVTDLAPGSAVEGVIKHADGSEDRAALAHTLNAEQVQWFKDGSALNTLRKG